MTDLLFSLAYFLHRQRVGFFKSKIKNVPICGEVFFKVLKAGSIAGKIFFPPPMAEGGSHGLKGGHAEILSGTSLRGRAKCHC